MISPPLIDKEKLVNSLLYIAEKAPASDIIHMVKILYFAEKSHLQEYGRLICGSTYARMTYGPVPSEAYDLLKALAGKQPSYFVINNMCLVEILKQGVEVKRLSEYPTYCAVKRPNMDVFSRSDLNCLDVAIRETASLNFQQLKDKSHDLLWKVAGEAKQHFIPFETFISVLPNRDALLEFVSDRG